MKLGQRAMIAAKVRSLNDQSIRKTVKQVGVAHGYVVQASVVLQYATDMVDSVISGAIALNDAYEEAQNRKVAVQTEEGKMQRLRQDAPDLAALVSEDRMSLAEAVGLPRAEVETPTGASISAALRKFSSAKTLAISVLEIPNFKRSSVSANQ